MAQILSKSRFTSGLQCELRLWKDIFSRDEATPPGPSQEARFALGHRVGQLAQQRYFGGVEVGFEPWERQPAVDQTRALMEDESIPAIYEAAFLHNDVFIRVDILERTSTGWNLIEVKSGTRPEKEVYLQDLAVQYWVMSQLQIPIKHAGLLVIDKEYVYRGGEYDLSQLFAFHDFIDDCKDRQPWVASKLSDFQDMLNKNNPPDISVGQHCSKPYRCPYFEKCSAGVVVDPFSIDRMHRLSQKKKSELREIGVESIADIPEDFPLNKTQARIRQAVLKQQPVAESSLLSAMNDVEWPLHFLDFETVSPTLPCYPKTRPYQSLLCQYSLHLQSAEGADVDHKEFIHRGVDDPRPHLIERLLTDISQNGSIIIYSNYEVSVISGLARDFPEYEAELEAIKDRLWDLKAVIEHHYYHPGFDGQFSIKQVLPVLVPESGWGDLDVADGQTAAMRYESAIFDPNHPEPSATFDALLNYCRQDTWAMVELRRVLLNNAALMF